MTGLRASPLGRYNALASARRIQLPELFKFGHLFESFVARSEKMLLTLGNSDGVA